MLRKRKQAQEIELKYGQPLTGKRLPSNKEQLGGLAFQGRFRGVKGHAV
jgi:hypothetical protein